jgi:vacuolar-type H+-ATPase subunit E/Vma4
MKPDLERLLKAMDAFKQATNRHEDARLRALYQAELEAVAETLKLNKEILDRVVIRYYPRWVRANLPPGFPKHLGLE